jgi:hypothetical protein
LILKTQLQQTRSEQSSESNLGSFNSEVAMATAFRKRSSQEGFDEEGQAEEGEHLLIE